MSKKSLNVKLKKFFENSKELSQIYFSFKDKLSKFKKKSFLIAVSGGPDSLALTALAAAYHYENNCKIFYVLVDHKLRKDSSKEAISVKKLLKKYSINLKILSNRKLITNNIQSRAREIRYDLLKNFCKKFRISTIITAHNLEDQVETFFIRLSRGSGLHGLSAMRAIYSLEKNIRLFRPLLDYKKAELIKISKKIFGKYYKDPSNNNNKYLRTRIRLLKKPLEKSGINYDQIFKSIKNLSSSRDTLDLYFEKIYNDLIKKQKKKIIIDNKNFRYLNKEMKMRVLQKILKELSSSYYKLRSKKIFNLINQIETKQKGKFILGGCLLTCEKTRLIVEKDRKK